MIYRELYDRLCNGELIYVKFTNVDDESVGCDDGPDNDMIARLTSIFPDKSNKLVRLFFDFSGFEDHNKVIASHNWYDADGNATLTWFETAHYPDDGKWSTYTSGTLTSAVELFELCDPYAQCPCCIGDEALYWEDGCNNAFIDSTGEMLVTVNGDLITFRVDCCPKCGRVFEKQTAKIGEDKCI